MASKDTQILTMTQMFMRIEHIAEVMSRRLFNHQKTQDAPSTLYSIRSSAFSLVELLVVIGIIAILFVMSMMGFQSILNSSRMDQAGRTVWDEINLARQTAATRNENVIMRFIQKPRTDGTGTNVYWKIQTGMINRTNTNQFDLLQREASLPTATAIDVGSSLSPLLAGLPTQTTNQTTYKSLTIRPTGEIEPTGTPSINNLPNWCLTIVPERDLGKDISQINDFVTIQIDPITAHPTLFRP